MRLRGLLHERSGTWSTQRPFPLQAVFGMQALNIYIALLERRRLLASVQRQNSLGSQGSPAPSTPRPADVDLDKVIQAIVPHVPMLASILSASSPSAVLVRPMAAVRLGPCVQRGWQCLPSGEREQSNSMLNHGR